MESSEEMGLNVKRPSGVGTILRHLTRSTRPAWPGLSAPLRRYAWAILVAFPGALVACSTAGTVTRDLFQDHMDAHFREVGTIQTAVIFGDLEEARDQAGRLADHQASSWVPPQGEPYLEAMQSTAGELAASTDPYQVALLAGQLGADCGRCHQALDIGPEFEGQTVPDTEPPTTMVRHIQGTDQLWEGLIGPSDVAWSAGAALLAEGSVDPEFRGDDLGRESMIVGVFRLGREAQDAEGLEDRADVFGRILGTCSGCHALP